MERVRPRTGDAAIGVGGMSEVSPRHRHQWVATEIGACYENGKLEPEDRCIFMGLGRGRTTQVDCPYFLAPRTFHGSLTSGGVRRYPRISDPIENDGGAQAPFPCLASTSARLAAGERSGIRRRELWMANLFQGTVDEDELTGTVRSLQAAEASGVLHVARDGCEKRILFRGVASSRCPSMRRKERRWARSSTWDGSSPRSSRPLGAELERSALDAIPLLA